MNLHELLQSAIQSFLQNALIPSAVGVIISLVIGIIAKKFPKDDLAKKYSIPMAQKLAIVVDRFMGKYLKPTDEEKIEQGIILTIVYNIDAFWHSFYAKLNELIFNRINSK